MKHEFEDKFSPEDQKIYDALFNESKNEYSESISLLKEIFSKKNFKKSKISECPRVMYSRGKENF